MKLFRVSTEDWSVTETEGEPYPGVDKDGFTCFVNTHYRTEMEALHSLQRKAETYAQYLRNYLRELREKTVSTEVEQQNAFQILGKLRTLISERTSVSATSQPSDSAPAESG